MGVPKNFHQTVNLPKMAEALNELSFYDFEYSVVLTENYNKQLREAEILGHIIETDLNVIGRGGDLEFRCTKSFSALDDESANNKIREWLDTKVDKGRKPINFLVPPLSLHTIFPGISTKLLEFVTNRKVPDISFPCT